jgi:hypothetical protein
MQDTYYQTPFANSVGTTHGTPCSGSGILVASSSIACVKIGCTSPGTTGHAPATHSWHTCRCLAPHPKTRYLFGGHTPHVGKSGGSRQSSCCLRRNAAVNGDGRVELESSDPFQIYVVNSMLDCSNRAGYDDHPLGCVVRHSCTCPLTSSTNTTVQSLIPRHSSSAPI